MITAVYEKIFTSKLQNAKWMMIQKIYFSTISADLKTAWVYLKYINEF